MSLWHFPYPPAGGRLPLATILSYAARTFLPAPLGRTALRVLGSHLSALASISLTGVFVLIKDFVDDTVGHFIIFTADMFETHVNILRQLLDTLVNRP